MFTKGNFEENEGEKLKQTVTIPHHLEPDIYNVMMLSPILIEEREILKLKPLAKAWQVGLFAFSMQFVIGILLIMNLLKNEYGAMDLNVPLRVSATVRCGQIFTIFLSLMMQTDVSSAICNVWFLRYSESTSQWKKLLQEDSQNSNTLHIWLRRILFPNLLKLSQAALILCATWIIIVQSDDFVDLIKNFTALFIVSSIDDVFFIMADQGVLGSDLSKSAKTLSDIELNCGEKLSFLPSAMTLIAVIMYICFALVMFLGLGVIAHRQDSGTYIRKRYPVCTRDVKDVSKLGDGICHTEFNNENCNFDHGDCEIFNLMYPNCDVQDPYNVGNGHCDAFEGYNVSECDYDGGDCLSLSCIDVCELVAEIDATSHSECVSSCEEEETTDPPVNDPNKYDRWLGCGSTDQVCCMDCAQQHGILTCIDDCDNNADENNEIMNTICRQNCRYKPSYVLCLNNNC